MTSDSRQVIVSYYGPKFVHKYWITASVTKAYPGKDVSSLTDWLDMTLTVLNGP